TGAEATRRVSSFLSQQSTEDPMRLPTLVVLCMATACAPIDEAPEAPVAPQEVTFTATDFAYTGPDTIAPGMTRMTMVNDGPQGHHLILIRIDDGHTYQ